MPVILAVLITSAIVSLLVTPVVLHTVKARGLHPTGRHRGSTVPRLGGVAVCVGMTVGIAAAALLPGGFSLSGPAVRFFAGVVVAAWVVFLAGVADDLWDLPPVAKLLVQCAAAGVAYAWGFRVEVLSLGEAQLSLGLFALPVTLLWIVGVTNAFNLIDGLDGLATGIAMLALATTFGVAALLGNAEVTLVCAALFGALLGFLRYNLRPARIFLGDSGSLFIGFLLAVLSVHGSTKSATAVLVVVPVMVLALPLLDTGISILRRWLRGVPIWGADDRHLHHRLLAIGLTHRRALQILYFSAAVLAGLGVVLAFAPPPVVAMTAVAGALATGALLLYGIDRLDYHEFAAAGVVLRSSLGWLRGLVRDQIHARDVAAVIRHGGALDEVRAVLEDNAFAMGFLSLELLDADHGETLGGSPPMEVPMAWKLEYPVGIPVATGAPRWVLRVWCGESDGYRLLGAERSLRTLSAAVREWDLRRVETARSPVRSVAAVIAPDTAHG